MHCHVLYTGGTIGMIPTDHGLEPGADMQAWLHTLTSRFPADTITFSALPCLIDSSNADWNSWNTLLSAVRHHDDADCLVILHGTDTLAYSGAALALAAHAGVIRSRPIILTGSQRPALASGSDAQANVHGALSSALSPATPSGVYLYFAGHLLDASCATKVSAWADDAFACLNPPATLAWSMLESTLTRTPGSLDVFGALDMLRVSVTPGVQPSRIQAALTPLPDVVVVDAFGAGNLPTTPDASGLSVADVIAQTTLRGTPVIVTSQCPQSQVRLGHYATSDALARAGALSAHTLTHEMCVVLAHALMHRCGGEAKRFTHAWRTLTLDPDTPSQTLAMCHREDTH